MKKTRIIPFWMLPMSWGLAGPIRAEREAYYYYDGFELEEKLAQIKYEGPELEKQLAELQYAHDLISERDRDMIVAKLVPDATERQIAILEAQLLYGEIDFFVGNKEIFTLRGKPWLAVINDGINAELGVNGYFWEFDWNDIWIDALREYGFAGKDDDDVMRSWFQAFCNNEVSASLGITPINSSGIIR